MTSVAVSTGGDSRPRRLPSHSDEAGTHKSHLSLVTPLTQRYRGQRSEEYSNDTPEAARPRPAGGPLCRWSGQLHRCAYMAGRRGGTRGGKAGTVVTQQEALSESLTQTVHRSL